MQQLSLNQVSVELNPTLTSPNWLFHFTVDDLNGTDLLYFLVETSSNERSWQFTINTTDNPMKTGEWVLKIYEKENTSNTDTTGLEPLFIGKVRIYKTFPADFVNNLTLHDERFDS